jgi:hypothetical protein
VILLAARELRGCGPQAHFVTGALNGEVSYREWVHTVGPWLGPSDVLQKKDYYVLDVGEGRLLLTWSGEQRSAGTCLKPRNHTRRKPFQVLNGRPVCKLCNIDRCHIDLILQVYPGIAAGFPYQLPHQFLCFQE